MEIGRKIKQIRLKRGLTQEELAGRTELSKGYISQLENDLCSPSIETLGDVLNILGVSLQEFFTENRQEQIVFTMDEYFESTSGDGTVTWLIPNSQKNDMEPIILALPVGGVADTRLPFEGEEFGYILCGQVAIDTPSGKLIVNSGESFSINGQLEHTISNQGDTECKLLWVTTPSNF